MKKIITLALVLAIGLTLVNIAMAREKKSTIAKKTNQKTTGFITTDSLFNFGKIPQAQPVTASFLFTNNTGKPIAITNVATSCGCTTPEYETKPVIPGKTTIIKVGYNAASTGTFYKTIAVSYGGGGTKNIYIQGEVQ